jgi:hypothetical protein
MADYMDNFNMYIFVMIEFYWILQKEELAFRMKNYSIILYNVYQICENLRLLLKF